MHPYIWKKPITQPMIHKSVISIVEFLSSCCDKTYGQNYASCKWRPRMYHSAYDALTPILHSDLHPILSILTWIYIKA